jgi:tetratricopeptide (TPR) repeat protein
VIVIRFAVATSLLLLVAACGRIEASRDFNFGVRYFNEEKYDAAIRSFESALESAADPAIAYNLALSHLAALRELSNDEEEQDLIPEQIAAALASVSSAQKLPEPSDELLAKLGYIEGAIHALAGNSEAARDSFQKSLSADPEFAPTLKAQLELDAESDSTLAKLVLATADIEKLEPEEKLSR